MSRNPQNLPQPLAELTFSVVLEAQREHTVRSWIWYQRLQQVRAQIPFLFVHDLGLAMQMNPESEIRIAIRTRSLSIAQERVPHQDFEAVQRQLEDYNLFLKALAETDLAGRLRAQKNSDALTAALVAHVFEGIQFEATAEPQTLSLTLQALEHFEPGQHLTPRQMSDVSAALNHLLAHQNQILIAIEQVDLEALKLLQMTQGTHPTSAMFLDLHHLFASSMANSIANFSMDLWPSVLETKKSTRSQKFLVDGYASVETRGSLESLLPSELVYDDDLFDRRYLQNEQLHYLREKSKDERKRLHVFLVDASASMRGLRTVFARGVALAMAKKALLAGDEVHWRFFDSRLHDRQVLKESNLKVPYLLCFKGERGRNTTEVFSSLHRELSRLSRKEEREIEVTFFSHSRCVVRTEMVLALKKIANLYGIFVTSTDHPMELDYLHHLSGFHVVSRKLLEDRGRRQEQAIGLLSAYEVGTLNSAPI